MTEKRQYHRKSISLSLAGYQRLREWTQARDLSMSGVVERLLLDFFKEIDDGKKV